MFPCQPRSPLAGVLLASVLPAHTELPHAPAYIGGSTYPAAARRRTLPPILEQKLGSLRYLAKPGDPLITQAGSSDFQHTNDYHETHAYLEKLVAASPGRIALRELSERSVEGHPILLVTASTGADRSATGLKRSAKPTLLMETEIHPDEANGRDAMFMLLRDMNAADRPLAGLLGKIDPLFISVANVDGDLRRNAYGRTNRSGPWETDWRVNGRNLNLNRDFTELNGVEIRNVTWVFNHYELNFFADAHSTDGTMYPCDSSYCHSDNG